MEDSQSWIIRDAISNDIPFVYSYWMDSYRYGSATIRGCRNKTFYEEYKKVIDSILLDESTKVRVLAYKSDPDILFGYLVSAPHTLHYLFVKERMRRNGIAKALLQDPGGHGPFHAYTHRTDILKSIRSFSVFQLEFNPFLIMKRKESPHGSPPQAI